MGTSNPFASLFGKSPFKALQLHMRAASKCAAEVPSLFEALNSQDQGKVEAVKNTIFQLEQEADDLKNQMRAHLPKSMFLPVDRRDLLEVLDLQDSIADTSQDIAGLLMERKMEVPVGMGEPLVALAKRCVDAVNQATQIIEKLDELVEMGFSGKDADEVQRLVDALSVVENETDVMGMELTRNLFAHEDEIKPVSVMFWYQLIQWVGDLADYSEKVGDRLRLLIAR